MKKTIMITLALSSALLATSPKVYVNMSQSLLSHSDNGTVSDFDPTGFKWTVGHNFYAFNGIELALEGTVMLGVDEDEKASVASSSTGTFTNASIMLDTLYNVNLRAQKEVVKDWSLQAYLGASRGKMIPIALNNRPNHGYRNSLTYGAGVSYSILEDVSLNFEYMQYFENLDAVEFGVGFRF
ncbi:porin family protein [bacterium]|nr:porin family protein [bacterium]MBU1957353.1 porin family protein [bacterium]